VSAKLLFSSELLISSRINH